MIKDDKKGVFMEMLPMAKVILTLVTGLCGGSDSLEQNHQDEGDQTIKTGLLQVEERRRTELPDEQDPIMVALEPTSSLH